MDDSEALRPSRQQEAGAASRALTRRRLLVAAGEEFAERGYHAATVVRIARRAGVTVQTLYLSWGSKRALLRAHMEAALAGDPEAVYAEEIPRLIDRALDGTGADGRAAIEHIARMYRGLAERAALGWRLYRDAAASDPEVAEDWESLQELRRDTFATIIERMPRHSLRPDITLPSAVDTAWAIASPETHELLVRMSGYTLDEYEHWVATTLCAALLG